MPFGLVNAHATFQTIMNEIQQEFLNDWVLVTIDDILLYSKDPKTHTALVRKVLQRLKDFKMSISGEKSVFHVKTVDFLCYLLQLIELWWTIRRGEQLRLESLQYWSEKFRYWWLFANFYWRFINKYFDICTLFTNLTRGNKSKFVLGKYQQEAFEYLKRCFTMAPIFYH